MERLVSLWGSWIACAAGWLPWAACRQGTAQADRHPPKVLTVHVWKAAPGTFQTKLQLDATLAPSKRVLIGPPIPGMITKITKDEGDQVRKGEVLVRVSPKEVSVQTIPLRSQLEAARAQAEAAAEVLSKLKDPYERAKKLYESGVITRMKFDEIQVQYSTAQAKKQAAERTAAKLQKELRRAYSKLQDTILRAPFDGYVIRRLVDEGDMARAFPPTIVLVLAKTNPIYARAEVPENYLSFVKVGQPVTVTVDAYPDLKLNGKVLSIRPDVDPITRTAKVRVEIPNPKGRLMPGMTGSLSFDLPPIRVLGLPRMYLASAPTGDSATVFVVSDNGVVELRRIQLGRILDPDHVEVANGLKAGDLVVTDHLDELRPGQRVHLAGRRKAVP